ncbi:MAG: FtsX-like permease family protein [Planctomycetia bacterium]|nr:FtsX-like permease family protein [Planctomycetia bacterium]
MKKLSKIQLNIDLEIALTHILAKKQQTIIVSFAAAIGIAAFIFMNSLVLGFNRDSDEALFKSTPHIRIYVDDKMSVPLLKDSVNNTIAVISNPKIVNKNKKLLNPEKILRDVKLIKGVTTATTWLNINVFYNNGSAQVNGSSSGVNINEANEMFDIQSTMVEGKLQNLISTPNGIIIGVGIAENLNIKIDDNISVVSPNGIVKIMKVVGLFKTSNSVVDKSKSYINLSMAQQLIAEGPDYITDIYVNVEDPNMAANYLPTITERTGYNAEDWKAANKSAEANKKTRGIMMGSISIIILIVAAFTIYNIVNMTIKQKLHDIAILKAQGFAGKSIVKIFISEALIIGTLGTIIGLILGAILVKILSKVYIGGDKGYFPIEFEPKIMIIGIFLGLLVTFIAGFIPAKGAAKVDPIAIFRNL